MNRKEISEWLMSLQAGICASLEKADGIGKFTSDNWERKEGGGGLSRVISNGAVLEKGGVMYSAVYGAPPAFLLKEHSHSFISAEQAGEFFAAGVSIVLHPVNPFVPIIHMNTRYFELCNRKGAVLKRWFGGGIDLTPHYINAEDASFFHHRLKEVCDRHDHTYYSKFKQWADDYFFIVHRQETRGIGGIFFDKLGAKDDFSKAWAFWKDVGSAFAPIYTELISRNHHKSYNDHHKQWQLLRRGRYVEFNLIYDKGTRFGLESGGRIESILVSLPKTAGWEYNFMPEPGSAEAQTLSQLRKGVNWI